MTRQHLQIFCDFDGTITRGDTTDTLLEALAHPRWKEIEARWENGEIGSRECMQQQVPLIEGGWPAMLSVLDRVEIDNSFATFVNWCKLRGVKISIVSDGIDRVIQHLLQREKVTVEHIWANHLIEDKQGALSLELPKAGRRVVCSSGLCKCQVLDAAGASVLKVVIGDGRSDFCWARNADLLFAKDKLLKHCQTNNIAHLPFDNFVQIRVLLEELMSEQEAVTSKKRKAFGESPALLAQS
ncbi:MAG TPA: MtnX-like HAD-IB family phosphatase [Candidatus Obscuribacterales bacterium]